MTTIEKNTIDLACFEVNVHGRLLGANKRFCRMFGFEESEVKWHYVTDLYRHTKDWDEFRCATEGNSFEARLKNRKGRSFDCQIIREVFTNTDGEICFRNTVQRKGEEVAVPAQAAPVSMVYLAKCAQCGQHIRVNSMGETRLRMLCDGCAAVAYPDAFRIKEAKL